MRRVALVVVALVCVISLGAVDLASPSPVAGGATLTVRVDARDFAFALSRRSVPAGSTVRFVVRNRGATVHDFLVRRKRTRLLRPGRSQTITVSFPRKGTYRFLCTVPGHARLGMKGAFGVSKKPPAPPAPPPPVRTSELVTLTPIGAFERPVLVTAPPGDASRIFVVEQGGAVRVIRDGTVLPRPFLDLRGQVTDTGESGLLSIAFAPDYAQSGLLYAYYNVRGGFGDIRISEFRRHGSDPDIVGPSTERNLITIPKPYENHNGGMLQFGPGENLFASVGDGDPGVRHPPGFFSQRLDVLLGKILRIDPRNGDPYAVPVDNPFVGRTGARPEIWAFGLRNPWRFWIDPETNAMLIGDVGSGSREEIDLVSLDDSGSNFGWPCLEGTLPFDAGTTCERPLPPLLDIPHENEICSVIGGVVARDPRIPALNGRYLYGDLCSGHITAVALDGTRVAASEDLELEVPQLTSFGVDAVGRVYVTSLTGDVFRLDPKSG